MGYFKKLTNTGLKQDYKLIVSCGYCGAYALTRDLERAGYNSGRYGWNWDCFELSKEIALITGYRNMKAGAPIDLIICGYEERAKNGENPAGLRTELADSLMALA